LLVPIRRSSRKPSTSTTSATSSIGRRSCLGVRLRRYIIVLLANKINGVCAS
jgi:hypothetical protein